MIKLIKKSALTLLLAASAMAVHAQKNISEGVVSYQVEAAQGPRTTKVYFKNNITRMEVESGEAYIKVYTDAETNAGKLVIDVDIAEQYIAVLLTPEEVKLQRQNEATFSDFVKTEEKQMISGYNSVKYTYKDNNGGAHELWATQELQIPKNNLTRRFNVAGTVVKFTTPEGVHLLSDVKEENTGEMNVDKIPSGYTQMTYTELMQMGG